MLLLASLALLSAGSSSHAKSAATGFAIAKNDPVKLRNFLLRMPKGGDLHNHLTGTIYAESYLGWAAEDGKCWDLLQDRLCQAPAPTTRFLLPTSIQEDA